MSKPVFFDHIEVHVSDIPAYCEFLTRIFQGGRYKTISGSGTAMFISNDGLNIEVKKKQSGERSCAVGFCQPCLRTENARSFIEDGLKLQIDRTVKNPDGDCYFFTDQEGVVWHMKDYLKKDEYVNW
ncbi:MAG: VOC family protein [Candidatus Margulisbacteria bacterium]|nr:VOC family protein [Candidatus Margulisiibacteriota bacterium]MBU1617107.1 VOC family protein [Candidatus Margulisiibacteriota bacterium]